MLSSGVAEGVWSLPSPAAESTAQLTSNKQVEENEAHIREKDEGNLNADPISATHQFNSFLHSIHSALASVPFTTGPRELSLREITDERTAVSIFMELTFWGREGNRKHCKLQSL